MGYTLNTPSWRGSRQSVSTPAFLSITDNGWLDYLRSHAITGEVNFWISSVPAHEHVDAGTLWLFKLHSPDDVIAAVAKFRYYTVLPLQLTRDAFGTFSAGA
jgi:hypothetical protein